MSIIIDVDTLKMGDVIMKKEKKRAILFYLASICFYLTSIICFTSKNDTSMGIVWLCLGSAMLCLGGTYLNKKNKDEEK